MSASNWADCPQCKAKQNLREDYEMYIQGEKFHATYTGQCDKCGFIHTLQHHETIKLAFPPSPTPGPGKVCEYCKGTGFDKGGPPSTHNYCPRCQGSGLEKGAC